MYLDIDASHFESVVSDIIKEIGKRLKTVARLDLRSSLSPSDKTNAAINLEKLHIFDDSTLLAIS